MELAIMTSCLPGDSRGPPKAGHRVLRARVVRCCEDAPMSRLPGLAGSGLGDDRRRRHVDHFEALLGPPRAFRTAELKLFHAARCRFWYSSWTSCGVL